MEQFLRIGFFHRPETRWAPLGSGGGIGGDVITYTVDGVRKVALADNYTMAAWRVKPSRARIAFREK